MKLVQSFDVGQADGTTITSGNSGDASNDAVTSTNAPVYDSTHAHSGTQSMKVPTGAAEVVRWSSLSGTHFWGRFYCYPLAISGVRIAQFDGNATTNLFRIAMKTTSGVITINIGGSGTANGAVAIPLNQWSRVEFEGEITGGNGVLTVKLFTSADSTTPDETIGPITVATSDTSIAGVRFGVGSSVSSNWWFDDLEANDTGWPGPLGGSTVDLDLGAIASAAATYGLDLARTRVLALGALSGGSVRGVDLVRSTPLALGAIPGGAATYGLDLASILGLSLGAIPGGSVHGIDLGRTRVLELGALTGGSPEGFDLTLVTLLDLGSIPSAADINGVDLARTTPLALAALASPAAVHGLDLAATRALALAAIPSAAAVHGLDFSATRRLLLGALTGGTLYGLDISSVARPSYLVLVHLLDADLAVAVLSDAIRVRCYDDTVMAEIADPALLAQLTTPTYRVKV